MLTVRQPEALSVDWVAEFDQKAFRRPHSVQSHGLRFEAALKTIGDSSDASSLQQARRDGLVVLFDGVLYNRPDLERALEGRGADGSDAALVLLAFARWGENFLDHIKGLFAVMAFDRATARLIAARDRFGEYPLFFADHDGRELLLSPSIDALLADPRVRRSLNRAALADHLCQRWPDPTETFFEAVRRVPPGHRLLSTPTGLKLERYWHPAAVDRSTKWSADDIDEFDDRLDTAVERVLLQGRSGILLSGGLDSVSVSVAATDTAARSQAPLPVAFSLAYPGPSAEEPVQRAVASSLGIEQNVVPFWDAVPGGSLLPETLRLTQTLPILLHSPWTPAYEHLLRLGAARGLKTMMTGCGGDEAFALNPLYAAESMRRGDVAAFVRHLVAWRRSYNTPISWYLKGMLWTYGLRTFGVSVLEQLAPTPLNRRRVRRSMEGAPSYVAPESNLNAELAQRVLRSFEGKKAEGPLHLRDVTARLEHSLESQASEENFERGRRLGIQLRHPLRDPDLTEMVYGMPHHLIYADGRAKYPLRQRVSRRFPSLGFDRQKKLGGTGFFRSILASELPSIWRRTSLSALDRLGVVDARDAQAMVNSALQSDNTRSLMPVWELVKLEAWAESRI